MSLKNLGFALEQILLKILKNLLILFLKNNYYSFRNTLKILILVLKQIYTKSQGKILKKYSSKSRIN